MERYVRTWARPVSTGSRLSFFAFNAILPFLRRLFHAGAVESSSLYSTTASLWAGLPWGPRVSLHWNQPFTLDLGPFTIQEFKTVVSLWKRTKCFLSTLRRKNFPRKRNDYHRPFWICVWGKLGHWNGMIIVTPSFPRGFQKVFSPHLNAKPVFSNSSCVKNLSEELLTWEIKPRFQILPP